MENGGRLRLKPQLKMNACLYCSSLLLPTDAPDGRHTAGGFYRFRKKRYCEQAVFSFMYSDESETDLLMFYHLIFQ
jgi:hypothetical protein